MDFTSQYISGQSGWTNMDNMLYNGHFENLVQADHVCSQVTQAASCAIPIVGQACSPVGITHPPSGASDILQQAMDVFMMTSPPNNPNVNYHTYSPATPSVSAAYRQVRQPQPFDKSYSINNDILTTPNQCGSSQSSFNSSLHVLRKESKNTVICTPELINNTAVELSPLNDQSDFLLRIACGSPGKSNGIQSNSHSPVQSPIVIFHPELQASSSSQQNSNLDKPMDTTSGIEHCTENANLSSTHLPCVKTHKVLSSDAANILSTWYERHLQYPYPTEEEVKELSDLTCITEKQVKKWMANKRVRCFNTLSITGNKHPIKLKYEGRGKKRKHSEVEKDDLSSSEPNFNGFHEESYRILNNWFDSHLDNPYPLEEEKKELAFQCGITLKQVKSWFANKRSRTNKTRKHVPNYFIKKFPHYAPIVEVIGQQREQARRAKNCIFSNSS